ncbi:coat protein [Havel River virus]|uniref:Capsid protein n=1 Tax=Havel river virus TaxID=254711 RepID=Q67BT1_HARV|nr:coat protein [Havel River virus]AAR26609.1 coat protein [Havel River virus]
MSIVTRNSDRALARLAAPAAMAGARMIVENKEVLWNGAKWIWANLPKRKKGNKSNGGLISHPQTLPGAIAAPISYAYPVRGRKPKFQASKGSVRITHREYISVIEGNTDGNFVVNNGSGASNDFSINPLNPFVFPWLVSIASNFDQYTFRSLKFEYIPLANTGASGRVALFFDKDSTDPGPDDRSALANYRHLSEISPWAIARLTAPTDNVKRFMADNTTADPKLINLGKVGWVTYASQFANLGDLFVEYTVDLYEAQPTAATLESLFRESTNGALTRVGLPYFTLEVADGTSLVYQARVPGTYLVTVIFNNTTAGFAISISGGGIINSSFGVSSAGRTSVTANVTITRNANLSITSLIGATNAQIFVAKANKDNAVAVV